jgi:phosphoenolpyruvate carboxykinase (GTP)
MDEYVAKFLEERLGAEQYAKLSKISNGKLYDFIVHFIKLLDPASVFVCDDSARDLSYISEKAIREGEEQRLAMNGHTLHFDSPLERFSVRDPGCPADGQPIRRAFGEAAVSAGI